MKPILALILAIALGVAAGYAYFSLEAANTDEPFYHGQWDATSSTGNDFAAKLLLSSDFYDFGAIKANKTYEANFDITNEGKAMLTFHFAGEPPSNVSINFEAGRSTRLPPGESSQLQVSVTPDKSGEPFRKVLVINGTDPVNMPKNISLIGRVEGGIESDQKVVSISRKTLDTDNVLEMNLYSFEHDAIGIQDVLFGQEEHEPWVEIDATPLSATELSAREGAKSGQRVSVKLKPDLPRNIRQIRLQFVTDAEGYSPINFLVFVAN